MTPWTGRFAVPGVDRPGAPAAISGETLYVVNPFLQDRYRVRAT